MEGATQRVVVIQDASKEISSGALEWALTGLQLKPGDELTLLAVLHQVNTPMGYKSKVDANSLFGANHKIVKEAVQKKKEEYENNTELMEIHDLYESNEINFSVLVVPASSPKIVAMEAVADVLKRVKNGENVMGIDEFSPPHSDLISSTPQRSDEIDEEKARERVKQKGAVSHLSRGKPLKEVLQPWQSSSTRHSSSRSSGTPTPTSSDSPGSSSTRGFRKRRGKSGSQSLVLYGEMLD